MKTIGRIVPNTMQAMARAMELGMTTSELDEIARELLAREGAVSAPQSTYDFPGATCLSVNEEIAHGIPGDRVIAAGRSGQYRRIGFEERVLRGYRGNISGGAAPAVLAINAAAALGSLAGLLGFMRPRGG